MKKLKELHFLDTAYEEYIRLPDKIKQEFGFKLWQIQIGKTPTNAKKLSGLVQIYELRSWDKDGTYRTIYTTMIKEKIIVLHAFQKKSQKLSKKNLTVIRQRQKEAKQELE